MPITLSFPPAVDPVALHDAVRRLPGLADLPFGDLEPMPVKGIAHDHVRLRGRGLLLRIPRLSVFGMAPADNLAYQAASFARTALAGRTPRLEGMIPPGPHLPQGALLVHEVVGRSVRLPGDLRRLAESLARIHSLPVPAISDRPPLHNHDDPVRGTCAVILRQAAYMPRAGVTVGAQAQIRDEIAWMEAFAADSAGRSHPVRLVLTDTQPGNFLVRTDGAAIAVDLEKMLYGSPAIDLAHATLYSSTRWDPEVATVLGRDAVAGFYRDYLDAVDDASRETLLPWLRPMRRLTWLRSLTFFMRWRVESAGTGDWSADRLGTRLAEHVRAHIADCLTSVTIARVRAEWLRDDDF